MPVWVEYYSSNDGKNFTLLSKVENIIKIDDKDVQTKDFTAEINTQARYIKIKAKNFGIIPDWHLGAGGQAFIFIDEIMID
jgi:hypothetical protein